MGKVKLKENAILDRVAGIVDDFLTYHLIMDDACNTISKVLDCKPSDVEKVLSKMSDRRVPRLPGIQNIMALAGSGSKHRDGGTAVDVNQGVFNNYVIIRSDSGSFMTYSIADDEEKSWLLFLRHHNNITIDSAKAAGFYCEVVNVIIGIPIKTV